MIAEISADWQVPSHEILELAPKRKPYCVAVFVINEGARLHAQLDRMRPLAGLVDILVSDGGSTDGSVTRDNMEPRQVRSLLVKTGAGKLGSQMRIAFAYALREGYEGVISIDGNDKDDPRSIDDFVTALEDGYGYLQGSRFIEGGRAINTPISRLAAIRFIHAPVVNWSAGFRYTDTTNGFRGYSRQLLADERVATFRDVFQGYELHYYLAIRAARLGYRIKEIPVTRAYPEHGPIPTKIRGLGGYRSVLKALFDVSRHRFDPECSSS
jgi:hypothetical protein